MIFYNLLTKSDEEDMNNLEGLKRGEQKVRVLQQRRVIYHLGAVLE